jgi:hypothetical protein
MMGAGCALTLPTFFAKLVRFVVEFCYGSSAYGISRELMQQRAELEQVFLLMVVGDHLGLPVYPSYYSRQLLPHLYPRLARWKRLLIQPKGIGSW